MQGAPIPKLAWKCPEFHGHIVVEGIAELKIIGPGVEGVSARANLFRESGERISCTLI